MMLFKITLYGIVYWGFIFLLSFYLITLLQWYNYSFFRILTKHHKKSWHIFYVALPLILFLISSYNAYTFYVFTVFLALIYLPCLVSWHLKLDRKLNFTKRIKTFYLILFILLIVCETIFILILLNSSEILKNSLMALAPFASLFCLILSLLFSYLYEMLLFRHHAKLARKKIMSCVHLKIIVITASFGKTSIKNFLYHILRSQFLVYMTPKSVNTIKGIVLDINNHLSPSTQFYIVEAGARQRGDIKKITKLLNPQIIVIGEIGNQHIEYFKTLENIIQTKFELLQSNRLEKIFLHEKNQTSYLKKSENLPHPPQLFIYPGNLNNLEATLDKTSFELLIKGEIKYFETKVLGNFNIFNLCAAILVATELKIPMKRIQNQILHIPPVQHRLQKIVTPDKIILDDSFNGNLSGMKEAIRLSSLYEGRKVIVTPGLIESDEPSNIELAKRIDEVFDLAIITGDLNSKILSQYIQSTQKIILKDKLQLENVLQTSTHKGDLILFANDAPNFI